MTRSKNVPFYYAFFGVLLFHLLAFSVFSQPSGKPLKIPEAELLVRFEHNNLFDISVDGKLLLLYGVVTPKKGKRGNATEWKARSGDKVFDMLRVVEWHTGKELAAIHVHTPPTAARFTPAGVCYRVTDDKTSAYENRLWDYPVNKISNCSSMPVNKVYRGSGEKYESDDGRLVAITSKQKVRQFLLWSYVRGVVSIERKSAGKVSVAYHPTVKEPLDWPLTGYVYSVAFDTDAAHLITSYEGDTFVWKLP